MKLYDDIVNQRKMISVMGLGYVGMPLAVAFAKKVQVIGYDISREKIELYQNGVDPTNEVGNASVASTTVKFTSDESELKKANFHIIAVPTPINSDKTPDLSPVESASRTIGRNLTKGSIVVYESTVYPGVTEDVCVPILENESGLKCGVDFKVGYSPERINPGDKINTIEKITKIVSGIDEESLEEIAKVYELVIKAGVHKASSIKVAEAAKVVENSQRDINIAFMNELAMVFDRMGVDTKEVVEAMNTKWNALGFTPGLVGGHCIGVDPYYFLYEAEKLGYHSQIILSGRKINDSMSEFVVKKIIDNLILANKVVKKSKVAIFGATFKENCPDIRNSKMIDIYNGLKKYGMKPIVIDPHANSMELKKEYGIELTPYSQVNGMDALVFAVAHDDFVNLSLGDIDGLYRQNLQLSEKVLIDVKGIFRLKSLRESGFRYWRM